MVKIRFKSDDIIEKFSTIDSSGNALLGGLVVSKKNKTIYFHIGKTGGSSISKLLGDQGFDDYVLSRRKASLSKKIAYFKEVAENWNDYYKFTFVRNKFDQMVSLYHYDNTRGARDDYHLLPNKNVGVFYDFIKNTVNNSNDLYGYMMDQYFLITLNGHELYDFVGTFENRNEDIKHICKILKIEYRDIRKNIGFYDKEKNIKDYYNKELEDILRQKFKKEFDYFKWDINKVLKNGLPAVNECWRHMVKP